MNLMNMTNSFVLNLFAAIFIISSLITIPLSFVTGRYFDNLLESRKLTKPLSLGIMPSAIMNRANLYIGYILWNGPKKRRWKSYRDQIGDFNFRAYARTIDYFFVFMSIINIISFVGFGILIFFS